MPFSNNDSMAETSEGWLRIQVAVSVRCVEDKGTNTEDPDTVDKAVQTMQNEDKLELRPNEQRIDEELKKVRRETEKDGEVNVARRPPLLPTPRQFMERRRVVLKHPWKFTKQY